MRHNGLETMNKTRAEAHVATDPVCGMMVDPHAGKPTHAHTAATRIISARKAAASNSPRILSAISTRRASRSRCRSARSTPARCTPRSYRKGPGPCPICGMALEPMGVHGRGHRQSRAVDFTRRLWMAAPLALALLALDMGAHVFGVDLLPFSRPRSQQWLKLLSPYRSCCGGAGRSSCAGAVDPVPLAQHVHPDRSRRRRGLSL